MKARVDRLIAHHGTTWETVSKELEVDTPDIPEAVAVCGDVARPGYTSIDASEFRDTPTVLAAKVRCLTPELK